MSAALTGGCGCGWHGTSASRAWVDRVRSRNGFARCWLLEVGQVSRNSPPRGRRTKQQLREVESGLRYTPTSCFETFAVPTPTDQLRDAIAAAARELDAFRMRWLNPPEWLREDVLEFRASADGPWATVAENPDANGIGTVRHVRLVPADDEAAAALKDRTLTNLYNEPPAWLVNAHRVLDDAVVRAYGWPQGVADGQIVIALLALNHERTASPLGV